MTIAALTCLRARQKLEIFFIHSSETTSCKIAIVLSCLLLNCGMHNTRLSLGYNVCSKSINFYKNGRKEWQKVVDWYKFEIEMYISCGLKCICNLYIFRTPYSYILFYSCFWCFLLYCTLSPVFRKRFHFISFSIFNWNVDTKPFIYINMFYKIKTSRRVMKSSVYSYK